MELRSPPPYERFTQAQPAGSMSNVLVLVGEELVEVTPTGGDPIESSYNIAAAMDARFFFRIVRDVQANGWALDGYDVKAIRLAAGVRRGTIQPVRRFPTKDSAVMWAIHRSAR